MGGRSNKVRRIPATDPQIMAPCGLNCGLCRAYQRERHPCPGCRGGDEHKSNACLNCVIKHCERRAAGRHTFCFSCDSFPCAALVRLDGRYRSRYGVSVFDNLARIQAVGTAGFVAEESATWVCPQCGGRLCMHEPVCGECGYAWRGVR